MRVLGIDPGTVRMGYGLIEGGPQPRAEDYGVIGLSKSMPIEHRLYQLYTHVLNLIHVFSPDAVAVEEPFVGKGERRFAGPAIAVGQAQALVLIGAAGQGLPVYRYSPAQIKHAITDYGAATKAQMQQTILAMLDLKQMPESDAADALSVGLCHLNQSRADSALAREITPGQERRWVIVGIQGTLEDTGPDWVHLRIGGVTLKVSVPAAAISELGPTGSQAHLFTHLRIRDDQAVLYGFPDSPALELFQVLLAVSGVGPRMSLALISSLGVAGVQQAIAGGDVVALSTVTGVGRRTAGRLVLELKGKLEADSPAAAALSPANDAEVIAALTALGYSASEARQAVSDLDRSPDLTVEDRIRMALQQFGGGG